MENKSSSSAFAQKPVKYVRYVLLGSDKGLYGGPFDTALSQARLFNYKSPLILFGHFEGDNPVIIGIETSSQKVRHLFGLRSFADLGSFAHFKALWKLSKCDLAHISFARGVSPILFTFFCRIRKSRHILQTHGMMTSRESIAIRLFDLAISGPLMTKASQIIALTSVEKEILGLRFPKLSSRISVVGNPPMLGVKPSTPHIKSNHSVLFAARLHTRKKVLDFAGAAKESFKNGWSENYKVLGPDEGDLSELLRETRGLSNFEYLGVTNSQGVLEKLQESAVFVLCSQDEPWGNVLVAALTLAKPVVVTKSSALSPLVAQFAAGIVVEDGNPMQLARAVHEMLSTEKYAEYSLAAANLAKAHFSGASIRDALEDIYSKSVVDCG